MFERMNCILNREGERESLEIFFHRMYCLEAVFSLSLIFGELDLFAGLLMELCKKRCSPSRTPMSLRLLEFWSREVFVLFLIWIY